MSNNKVNQWTQDLEGTTRRHFLWECAAGLGGIALSSLWGCSSSASKLADMHIHRNLSKPFEVLMCCQLPQLTEAVSQNCLI